MFENLRDAFREAVDNFKTELRRDEIPAAADRLLRAMEGELVRVRSDLKGLEEELAKVEERAEREEAEARTCLRREEMAQRIGDEETVEVARRYARRHLKFKDVLVEKSKVLQREITLRRTEVQEMEEQLQDARTHRESLLASASRTEARTRIEEADDLFQEMDRMAERIQEMEGRAQAAEEIDALDLDGASQAGAGPPSEEEMDARLAALKRQMGRE